MSKDGNKRRGKQHTKIDESTTPRQPLVWADLLQRALTWAIDEKIFAEFKKHGNTKWVASQLVVLAVLWVWSDQATLTGAFRDAHQLAVKMFGDIALASYQGLTGALLTWTASILSVLWPHLHSLMEAFGGDYWRIGRWLPLAVDGSRASTPRTKSNEAAFSAKKYGHGSKAKSRSKWRNKKRRTRRLAESVTPQIWLTLIWHMGLGMPWCWKTGPSTASERHHFLDLLKCLIFPKDTLFCCDAGFVGYDLWKALLDDGHQLLIRVGGNVRLLTGLCRVKRAGDIVYLWPKDAASRGDLPLILRLLKFQGPRGMVYLVTSVLSEKDLTWRNAKDLYKMRWGIELQFRSLKQTFGRGKLRSRTADNALVELEWSLVGLWLVQLFAVKEQIEIDSPPKRSSVALALAVIRDAMRCPDSVVPNPRALAQRLAMAVKDQYTRHSSKQARYKTSGKDQPSATKPILSAATAAQREAYANLRRLQEKSLTA